MSAEMAELAYEGCAPTNEHDSCNISEKMVHVFDSKNIPICQLWQI